MEAYQISVTYFAQKPFDTFKSLLKNAKQSCHFETR